MLQELRPASPEAYKLFHEGILALSQIEANGIRIDLAYLKEVTTHTKKQIKRLEEKLTSSDEFRIWKKRFHEKTKLGSHEQLGTIIFDTLGHKRGRGKKVKDADTHEKTVKNSNDQSAFEHVELPFVKDWFEWQKLNKLDGTYISGIANEVQDGYLHPFFDLHIPRTYRGSSSRPNFQNYPVRNPMIAELIRKCFIARDGHLLVENDFGGIEVCIGTCYHRDPMMIKYIKSGYDYHKEYAAKCFKIDPSKVSKQARYCGKNMFVFPEFYGSYYIDAAPNLWEACTKLNLEVGGVPMREHLKKMGIKTLGACESDKKAMNGTFEKHIQQVEQELWELFHVYAQWKKDFVRLYRKRGWFQLHTGFICSGLYRNNEVTNYPVQGAAFHCLLWVLTQLQKWLNKYKMKTKLVGQIHDSIIGDVHASELDDYLAQVKYLVEEALPKHFKWICVPMKVEAEIAAEGKSWFHKRAVSI